MKTNFFLYTIVLILFLNGRVISQTWVSLGGGVQGPAVHAIEQYNGQIIAGGNFDQAGNVNGTRFIAKWNGSVWSTVGPPSYFTGPVYALTMHNNELIAGGNFNPGSLFKIASWNGTAWLPLGSGSTDGIIYALFSWRDTLYAGGAFTRIGGVYADNIAKWDGTVWSPLGSGTNGNVLAITADGFTGKIVAGGSFNQAGGINNVNNVAEWNGTLWSAMGSGLDGVVNTLESLPWGVLAGGGFNHHICVWAGGSSWGPFGGGIDTGNVFTISAKLYQPNDPALILVGGTFRLPPFSSYNNIGSYIGGGWNYIGTFDNYVYKIFEASPYDIYAAGNFITSGGNTVNKIARLNTHIQMFQRVNLRKPIYDYGVTFDTMPGFGDKSLSFQVEDVNISIDTVQHTNNSDLVFILKHNGISDTLIYNAGGTGDNFICTYLNDSAFTPIQNGTAPFTGEFRPHRPLSQFNGVTAAGSWVLEIHDRATGNTGMFNAWSITIQLRDVIGIQQINTDIPKKFTLSQNYPNPFNPMTKIKFNVPKSSNVNITVFDVLGRHITTLVNEKLNAGSYETEWNANNMPGGVYFYKIETESYSETKKMVLVK
jgi:hypothetical protein